MAKAKDRRTKSQLLGELAQVEAALLNGVEALGESRRETEACRAQLADMQRSLYAANERMSFTSVELMDKEYDVERLTDELRLVRADLQNSDSVGSMISEQLHKEVDGRAREQVLIRALVATLAEGRSDRATDVVRRGAEKIQVDVEVALEEFDKYFRRDILQKAELEATAPLRMPKLTGNDVDGMMLASLDEVMDLLGLGQSYQSAGPRV